MTEEEAYNIAYEELQSQRHSQGIMAKAIAYSEGDEKRTQANYLRFRAEQLLYRENANAVVSSLSHSYAVLFSPCRRISSMLFSGIFFTSIFLFIVGAPLHQAFHYWLDSSDFREVVEVMLSSFGFLVAWIMLCAIVNRVRDAYFKKREKEKQKRH